MQYALFEDIRNRATVDTKPSPSGGQSETVRAYFKPSAAMEAGLGGFGTTTGTSGSRYVFTKTSVEQAVLYSKALFAVGEIESGGMQISADVLSLWVDGIPDGAEIFVHILEADQTCRGVLKDLQPV